MSETYCHCGLELHYSDPKAQAYIESIIAERGPNQQVVLQGVTYLVPRHFIALHGLKAMELPGLGFPVAS